MCRGPRTAGTRRVRRAQELGLVTMTGRHDDDPPRPVSSPFGALYVIANPKAGRGMVGQELPELERALRQRRLDYEIHETAGPGEGERLARAALEAGFRFLVGVGDDAPVDDVVNGMIEDDEPLD